MIDLFAWITRSGRKASIKPEESGLAYTVDRQLAHSEYLADQHAIADIISYPWVARYYGNSSSTGLGLAKIRQT